MTMSSILKTLAVVSAVTVGGAVIAQGAFAQSVPTKGPGAKYSQSMRRDGGPCMRNGDGRFMHHGSGYMHNGSHRGGWMSGWRMNSDRTLTESQIRTLAQAHIIRMGNDHLKVGKISKDKVGNYNVSIVTKDDSLVNTVVLDKATGFPVR